MKNRVPRKIKKKRQKGWCLQYDVASLPVNINIDYLVEMVQNSGIIVFNSATGIKPEIIKLGGNKHKHLKKAKIVDISKHQKLYCGGIDAYYLGQLYTYLT